MNNQTEDMASETAIADMSGRPSAGGHCDSMVEYLREAHRMVSRLLQEADFNDVFPFVFGHPSVVGDAVVVQNELALLLYTRPRCTSLRSSGRVEAAICTRWLSMLE